MNQQIVREEEEDSIDLLELYYELKKNILVLIIFTVLGAMIFGVVSKLFIRPTYKSNVTLYVFDQTTSITTLSDLQMGTQLASDFTILATSEPVVNKMIEKLNLQTDFEQIVDSISAKNQTNTRLIEITVANHDPEVASQMANALAEALVERVREIMDTSKAYVAVPASVPKNPSSPHVKRNAVIGGLLGFFAVAAVVIVRFMMDDTIKTAEDVEKYLGLVTVAEIPMDYSNTAGKGKLKKSSKEE